MTAKEMITKLTPEQEAMLPVYRDKWIEIGLKTGPCNYEEECKWVNLAYEKAGLDPPKEILRARGPREAIKMISERTGETKSEVLSGQMYGQHDANWLGYYEYFWKEVGIEECHLIEGLIGIAQNGGWWNAYETFALIQDRPIEIHRDEEGRLHREDGPALSYADGLQVWSIDGYRVNEQIVLRPETLTIDQIHTESNADVQSIMIDRFGWDRYIEETDAKFLDSRHNYVENTKEALYDCGDQGLRLLVTCPTGRVFTKLILDSSIRTCEDAQFWLGNDMERKFNVIGRT